MNNGMRARVERLLSGELKTEDITRIFLFAREHCDGRRTVKEIGDFVAHHTERNQGLMTAAVRGWSAIALFHGTALRENRPFTRNRLPNYFPIYLDATSLRIDQKWARSQAAMSLSELRNSVKSLNRRLISNADGSLSLPSGLSQREVKLVDALCNVAVVQPAFTADKLISELAETLKSNALLKRKEFDAFLRYKDVIALFAVTLMHNCTIRITDTTTTMLKLSAGEEIEIVSSISIDEKKNGAVLLASALFSTNIAPSDACDLKLLQEQKPWEFDLELINGRLSKLG